MIANMTSAGQLCAPHIRAGEREEGLHGKGTAGGGQTSSFGRGWRACAFDRRRARVNGHAARSCTAMRVPARSCTVVQGACKCVRGHASRGAPDACTVLARTVERARSCTRRGRPCTHICTFGEFLNRRKLSCPINHFQTVWMLRPRHEPTSPEAFLHGG